MIHPYFDLHGRLRVRLIKTSGIVLVCVPPPPPPPPPTTSGIVLVCDALIRLLVTPEPYRVVVGEWHWFRRPFVVPLAIQALGEGEGEGEGW